jgi:hypothetical protein
MNANIIANMNANSNSSNNMNTMKAMNNLNHKDKNTITKLICIDSLFRTNLDNTSSNNFTYQFIEPIKNILSMQIISLEIPNTWYTFSKKKFNNWFSIKVNDISGNGIMSDDIFHNIIIPDGNYMASTFETILNNYFNNYGFLHPQSGLQFLHATVSDTSSKVIFRARNIADEGMNPCPFDESDLFHSPNLNFTIKFDNPNVPLYKTAGWMMGFRKPSYKLTKFNTMCDKISYSMQSVQNFCYLESESSYGNAIDQYFYLYIEDYNKNYVTDIVTSYTNKSYMGSNTMARISITSGHNTVINDNASDLIFKKREYFGPVNIEKLNIKLLDKYGDEIDNLDNNFSMVIKLKILN